MIIKSIMIQKFIIEHYLQIKALHIISVICWMAGLLYLPRLFVYHATAQLNSELDKTFRVMEYKLLKYIMNPSMITTFITGGLLIFMKDFKTNHSLHVKLFFVLLLAASHGVMARHRKLFAEGRNTKSHVYFRILNEIPTVCMICIVFIVILKPF